MTPIDLPSIFVMRQAVDIHAACLQIKRVSIDQIHVEGEHTVFINTYLFVAIIVCRQQPGIIGIDIADFYEWKQRVGLFDPINLVGFSSQLPIEMIEMFVINRENSIEMIFLLTWLLIFSSVLFSESSRHIWVLLA